MSWHSTEADFNALPRQILLSIRDLKGALSFPEADVALLPDDLISPFRKGGKGDYVPRCGS